MICYRDQTFCTEETCKHFENGCINALTKAVQKSAHKWWGSKDAPICVWAEKPKCYEEESIRE